MFSAVLVKYCARRVAFVQQVQHLKRFVAPRCHQLHFVVSWAGFCFLSWDDKSDVVPWTMQWGAPNKTHRKANHFLGDSWGKESMTQVTVDAQLVVYPMMNGRINWTMMRNIAPFPNRHQSDDLWNGDRHFLSSCLRFCLGKFCLGYDRRWLLCLNENVHEHTVALVCPRKVSLSHLHTRSIFRISVVFRASCVSGNILLISCWDVALRYETAAGHAWNEGVCLKRIIVCVSYFAQMGWKLVTVPFCVKRATRKMSW